MSRQFRLVPEVQADYIAPHPPLSAWGRTSSFGDLSKWKSYSFEYTIPLIKIRIGLAEALHLVALVALLWNYVELIKTVKFSKPKDFFTNINNKDKKNIEKYGDNQPDPDDPNTNPNNYINYSSFHYKLNPDEKERTNEIYTNMIGFILGITASSYIKVQFLDQISSDDGWALLINCVAFGFLIYTLYKLYYASLYQQGDPTSESGRYAYAFYPLLGGLVLIGETLIIRIGDGITNMLAENGFNHSHRGDLITRNRINNLVDAVKKIFPNLNENSTIQKDNAFDYDSRTFSILNDFSRKAPDTIGGLSSISDYIISSD